LIVYLRGPTMVFYLIQVSANRRLRTRAYLSPALPSRVNLGGDARRPAQLDFGRLRQPRGGSLICAEESERSRPGSSSFLEMGRIVYCDLLDLCDHRIL
jgi:hypothetical protein